MTLDGIDLERCLIEVSARYREEVNCIVIKHDRAWQRSLPINGNFAVATS